jgi:hypothetical protein
MDRKTSPQMDIAAPLPHSLEAERSVLGAIILDNAALATAQEIVAADDFFLPENRVLYRAMSDLAKSSGSVDTVLLVEWLSEHDNLEKAGGVGYISQLGDGLPRVSNVGHYGRIVKTKARARRLIEHRHGDIERLLGANGDLEQVIQDVLIHSAHIQEEFGQKESSGLFCTAADVAEEPSPEFVVKPYILAGAVTELTAKIKAGKTTYVLGEVVRQALYKGAVVYLTEQPKASFRVALGRAGLVGLKTLHILYFNRVIGRTWDEIARIAAAMCRDAQAVLLVVDTLPHFCGLDGDSENDSGAAIAAMKPLQNIASAGTGVLTVRHERKSGGEIGDAGRGSSAYGGAADTLLTLRRPEGRTRPTLRKIECVSRFDGLPADAIYEYQEGRYQYMGTENEISEREAEEVILAAAPDSEEDAKTPDDLLAGSEIARTTAQRVVKRLCSEGRLQQIGKGKRGNPFRYLLPEKDSAQTTHIYGQKESLAKNEALI